MGKLEKLLQTLDPQTLAGAGIIGGMFFVAGLILSWLVRQALRALLIHDRSEKIDEITLSFLSSLTILAMWLFLATFYAHLIPALNRLSTALLASASLVSVIVGFSAQTTLSNIVSGISLVLYKPFRRGDRLTVTAPTQSQCETGVVEDISLGYTVLRTDDGRKIVVANGTMAQQTLIKLPPQEPDSTHSAAAKPSA